MWWSGLRACRWTQIEYAGGRPLLQYRGELLPLRDEGDVLPELEAAQAARRRGVRLRC